MADTEGNLDAKQFRPDVPQEMAGFHVKGAEPGEGGAIDGLSLIHI